MRMDGWMGCDENQREERRKVRVVRVGQHLICFYQCYPVKALGIVCYQRRIKVPYR